MSDSLIDNLSKIRFIRDGDHWGVTHADFPGTALPISEAEATDLRQLGVIQLRDELVSRYSHNAKTAETLRTWGIKW